MSESLTEIDIRRVVVAFYAKVRRDALLGPVFATRIEDTDAAWREHENHITDFWSSVFLKTGRFSGNPMAKHIVLADITPAHFKHWLELFRETALSVMTQEKADLFETMTQRIALNFQMGLAYNREKSGQVDHPFKEFS
jgi:hemoglobin